MLVGHLIENQVRLARLAPIKRIIYGVVIVKL
jgi:hypothetical protein